MLKPSIDLMFKGKENRYALAIGIAKRARKITDDLEGDVPEKPEKAVKIAEREFKERKYAIFMPDIRK